MQKETIFLLKKKKKNWRIFWKFWNKKFSKIDLPLDHKKVNFRRPLRCFNPKGKIINSFRSVIK